MRFQRLLMTKKYGQFNGPDHMKHMNPIPKTTCPFFPDTLPLGWDRMDMGWR